MRVSGKYDCLKGFFLRFLLRPGPFPSIMRRLEPLSKKVLT